MLGAFGVGKTSLTRRFVYDIFDDSYLSTIGVKVSQKILAPLTLPDGKMVQYKFLIWDIEGFEQASLQMNSYLTGASGALLICDLTRPDTIQLLSEVQAALLKVAPAASIMVVGNKSDAVGQDSPIRNDLVDLATQIKAPFEFSSAKTGQNVEESFSKLGLLLAQQ